MSLRNALRLNGIIGRQYDELHAGFIVYIGEDTPANNLAEESCQFEIVDFVQGIFKTLGEEYRDILGTILHEGKVNITRLSEELDISQEEVCRKVSLLRYVIYKLAHQEEPDIISFGISLAQRNRHKGGIISISELQDK